MQVGPGDNLATYLAAIVAITTVLSLWVLIVVVVVVTNFTTVSVTVIALCALRVLCPQPFAGHSFDFALFPGALCACPTHTV